MASFRSGRVKVLVATDIAARGLDVPDIRCVINFDLPAQVEDYVHRVGRTGRGDATGHAVSFVTDSDFSSPEFPKLVDLIERCGQTVPEEIKSRVRGGGRRTGPVRAYGGGGGRGGGGGGGGGRGGDSFGRQSSGYERRPSQFDDRRPPPFEDRRPPQFDSRRPAYDEFDRPEQSVPPRYGGGRGGGSRDFRSSSSFRNDDPY